VKAKVNECSVSAANPGGMAKFLQPLDVVIDWPLKDTFRRLYDQLMATMNH
jgi:hypothetical protein